MGSVNQAFPQNFNFTPLEISERRMLFMRSITCQIDRMGTGLSISIHPRLTH